MESPLELHSVCGVGIDETPSNLDRAGPPTIEATALPLELPRARIDKAGKAEQRGYSKRARNKESG